jgi:putative ATP-dependent endonuclease of the OLD family
MRIQRAQIHNFRSIRDLRLECQPLTVLLGPNNHGKSNVVLAVEFGLSTSAKVDPDDFFAFRENDDVIWIEIEFGELTDQEKTTFRKYVGPHGTLKIRKTAVIAGSEPRAVEVGYRGYIWEPEEWWLRSSAIDQLMKREELQKATVSIAPLAELLAEKGRVTKSRIEEFQARYIQANRDALRITEKLEEAPFLGQKNVGGGVLPDFYLMPAVRDLADETKTKPTTAFGRLLQRAVREMMERDPRVAEVRDRLEALLRWLNSPGADEVVRPAQLVALEKSIAKELEQWKVEVAIEVKPPELERIFELGTELHVDDGLRTPADRKGHGLQRAILFALLRAWANALREAPAEKAAVRPRATSESVIFAVEEPELFLHPHAQRRLAGALKEIASAPEHQVLVCTHSAQFVDLNYHKSILVVFNEDPHSGTSVRQCSTELFAGEGATERKRRFQITSWINPDRGELFFARKVVLVEGETEAASIPLLGEKLSCHDADVSVINCGNKHNILLYLELLRAFQIPHFVVHDEDPLPYPIPEEWDADKRREKRRLFELNAEIAATVRAPLGQLHLVSPDFEGAAGIPRRAGEIKGKPLAAVDYFAGMTAANIPAEITQLVRAAYR